MLDLTNHRYGRWLVISEADRAKPNSRGGRQRTWRCICDCGKITVVHQGSLRNGRSKSCGCYQRELAYLVGVSHGRCGSRVYKAWDAMKQRCQNPNEQYYCHYGGRGIKVCDRWQVFENFYEDMGDPPMGFSLERVDNAKGYSPKNCIWADCKTQARNRRTNHYITINGETKCVSAWCESRELNKNTVMGRLCRGWSEKRALGLEA